MVGALGEYWWFSGMYFLSGIFHDYLEKLVYMYMIIVYKDIFHSDL